MNEHDALGSILLLVLVTVIGPVLAVRVRAPTAVVLILAGVGIGPAGLDLVHDTPAVALLSELGFLVLMFVAGMEIDFESLRGAGLRSLLTPTLSVVAFFAVAIGLTLWIGLSAIELLVVSASSVGMPLAILQETKRLQTPVGRHVLLTASIGEFVSILAITGYELFAEDAPLAHRGLRLGKVLLLFVLSALLIRWARAAVWWRPEPFRRLTQHHDVAEFGVRTGLLVMFAFVVFAAMLGVEAILGAFIAGALVAFVLREKHAIESKIGALGQGLFIPVFFVVVGVRFDPRLLDVGAIRDAGLLFAVVAAVKFLPSLVFASRDLGARERLAAGALLSAPLTLVVAIGVIGKRLGAVDDRGQASFILLAMLLSVGFPILFRVLLRASPAGAAPRGG
ncbi:MAG: cation:proton antiporter [Labilithrix sp.]|nr:cation:proton antiporter [Labilithrix sp.]